MEDNELLYAYAVKKKDGSLQILTTTADGIRFKIPVGIKEKIEDYGNWLSERRYLEDLPHALIDVSPLLETRILTEENIDKRK